MTHHDKTGGPPANLPVHRPKLEIQVSASGLQTWDKRVPVPDGAAPSRPDGTQQSRRVFVIHGRDTNARRAVFDFLFALGLQPLDWEQLVSLADVGSMPFLGEVIAQTLPKVQAVIALLTPDDVVELHPDMCEPGEPVSLRRMQARPNVLLELGMAMAIHPRTTLILTFGHGLDIGDLAGRNYVRVGGDLDFRSKIAGRLATAGCPVRAPLNGAWRMAGAFETLAAHGRKPH